MAEEKPSHPYVVEGADGQSRSGWQWVSVFLGWGLLQSGKTVTVTVTIIMEEAEYRAESLAVMASVDEKV
ncbi:hypothetical protein BN1708_009632 [Verticillium longisporum]|uniref:Uncharacterized protein n=1 Tax=Verticillium longisporum TaxID=100787 RepID=A0A0G4KJ58_VERLO|nr:hypothetical protein BN1708_009632 [Verticillium longisporum]